MAKLTFISVKGLVPHSAAQLHFEKLQVDDMWLGFGPAQHHSPGWPKAAEGKIFSDDETHRLNHGIIFSVPDDLLFEAARTVTRMYADKKYKVGVVDCVSFTADLAREVGLRVPLLNFTPYGLIEILGFWNKYEKKW